MASRVEGLASLRAKVLSRLPAAARAKMKAANQKNADEFATLVKSILPRGDPAPPNLVDTLKVEDDPSSETGVMVSIGGPEAPYPLHLEGGHQDPGGGQVAPRPAWNPAKRVLKKRAKARAAAALRAAVKITAEGKT